VPAPTSTLLILGAGGHGRVVADAALAQGRWVKVRVTDRDSARVGEELLPGLRVEPLQAAMAGSAEVHVAIGSATSRAREVQAVGFAASLAHRNPTGAGTDALGRVAVSEANPTVRRQLATVIHPKASVSPYAELGAGTFIAASAVIAPGARVGPGVIVNHGAVVDHDVQVGAFTHIAPRVALGGGVTVGDRVLVGAGATVLPGVRIADDVVVGAGAVVRDNLDAAGVYAGVPARRVR